MSSGTKTSLVKNKSLTSTLIDSTSKNKNEHISFRIPRQVAYEVDLIWGKEKTKYSAKVSPEDQQTPGKLKKGMGTLVAETLPVLKSRTQAPAAATSLV